MLRKSRKSVKSRKQSKRTRKSRKQSKRTRKSRKHSKKSLCKKRFIRKNVDKKSSKHRKSTFAVNQITQKQRIGVKNELYNLKMNRTNLIQRSVELNDIENLLNQIQTGNKNYKEVEQLLKEVEDKQSIVLRQQLSDKNMLDILSVKEVEREESRNKRSKFDNYKQIYDSLVLSINEQIDRLADSRRFNNRQLEENEKEIKTREEFIEKSLAQAVEDEKKVQENIPYQPLGQEILNDLIPSPSQDYLRRRAEHGLRTSGEFIFDYENMCNNIGVSNNIGQIELYNELEHFVTTGQISKSNIILLEKYGIFNDFNNIPELEQIKSTENEKILKYGQNQLTIILNRILGKGSYGDIYEGFINDYPIIIKMLKNNPSIVNLAAETIIQVHLYCKYNRTINQFLLKNPTITIAKIPKIVSIGKIGNEYLIGMEKLDGSFKKYIKEIFTQPLQQQQAEQYIKNVQTAVVSIRNLLFALFEQGEEFMHRDLHCDNIMYRMENRVRQFYLIDFGMSVLITRGIKNNGISYDVQNELNRSHDMRFLLSDIIYNISIAQWDLIPLYARNIAKRFAYCVKFYHKFRKDNKSIFHSFKKRVVNIYDWRFDFSLFNDMFQDFAEQEKETRTPTPHEIANIPNNEKDALLSFVKRYYIN